MSSVHKQTQFCLRNLFRTGERSYRANPHTMIRKLRCWHWAVSYVVDPRPTLLKRRHNFIKLFITFVFHKIHSSRHDEVNRYYLVLDDRSWMWVNFSTVIYLRRSYLNVKFLDKLWKNLSIIGAFIFQQSQLGKLVSERDLSEKCANKIFKQASQLKNIKFTCTVELRALKGVTTFLVYAPGNASWDGSARLATCFAPKPTQNVFWRNIVQGHLKATNTYNTKNDYYKWLNVQQISSNFVLNWYKITTGSSNAGKNKQKRFSNYNYLLFCTLIKFKMFLINFYIYINFVCWAQEKYLKIFRSCTKCFCSLNYLHFLMNWMGW